MNEMDHDTTTHFPPVPFIACHINIGHPIHLTRMPPPLPADFLMDFVHNGKHFIGYPARNSGPLIQGEPIAGALLSVDFNTM